MRRHRRSGAHHQADGGCGLLKAEWFTPPDSGRQFLWDSAAAVVLAGPQGLDLSPGLRVADVGCGWGYLGHVLLGQQPRLRVDGFDLDTEQLTTARERAAPGLRFHQGDALALDVDDARYDRAVCQTLLVHQPRPEEVLRELARIVRPEGRVVAIEPDWTDVSGARSAVVQAIAAGARATGAGTYDVGSRLRECFEAAGLQVLGTWRNPTGVDPADPRVREHLLHQTRADVFAAAFDGDLPLFEAGGGDAAIWAEARAQADTERLELRRRLLEGPTPAPLPSALQVCVGHLSSD